MKNEVQNDFNKRSNGSNNKDYLLWSDPNLFVYATGRKNMKKIIFRRADKNRIEELKRYSLSADGTAKYTQLQRNHKTVANIFF